MSRFTAHMNETNEPKPALNLGAIITGCACMLIACTGSVVAYQFGFDDGTRATESRIDTEHQEAIENEIVCKLSLALTQERLQRFEQTESEQLQSCCIEE